MVLLAGYIHDSMKTCLATFDMLIIIGDVVYMVHNMLEYYKRIHKMANTCVIP